MLKILVILASTREPRTGEKIANWYINQVDGQYPEMEFELVDLKKLDLPWFYQGSPKAKDKKYEDKKTQDWSEQVEQADGFVIITPEYNHGYPAPLKNVLDALYFEWNNKPVTFVSYGGGAGGSRAVEQLRQVAVELQMAPIKEAIHIVNVWNELDEKGQPKDQSYAEGINRQLTQLEWWTKALKVARENT